MAKNEQDNGKPTSKMAAVRLALEKLGKDAKPAEIVEHAKNEFGIVLDAKMASVYKSQIGKGKGGKARTPRAPRAAAFPTGDAVSLVVAVKGLAQQAGGMDNLKKLVDAMS